MSLTMLSVGQKAKVLNIHANSKLKRHLTELGFTLGRTVEVVQHIFGSNLIIALEGARMAVDQKVAHQIHITLEEVKET